MKILMTMALAFVGWFGCSVFEKDKDSSKKPDDAEKTYSYSFSYNGCETGEHVFDKILDYCKALINEPLNKECAQNLRFKTFHADCKQFIDSGELTNPGTGRDNEENDDTYDGGGGSTTPATPSFSDEIKGHTVTFTIKNQELINKLSATVGTPGYNRAYVQDGKLTTSADLESGAGHKFCAMKGLAFASAGTPYEVDPANVKERIFFGNAIIEMSLQGLIHMECEKILASSMTTKDLQEIFGDLIIVASQPSP